MGGVEQDSSFYLGVILAVTASLFIGTSFILKKKALMIISRKGCVRASNGGFSYLKEWVWWSGLICMGVGESLNMCAYAWAPASLVTPLGVLSVLVSAILSHIILRDKLNILGKLGCALCLTGSTFVVLHAPSIGSDRPTTYTHTLELLTAPIWLAYMTITLATILFLCVYAVPKYGRTHIMVTVTVCSLVGGLMVMSCKCLGEIIREKLSNNPDINFSWFVPIGLATAVGIGIAIQMAYLNRALDAFGAAVVTPVYYVTFTGAVLIDGALLLGEMRGLAPSQLIGLAAGLATIVIGVVLLNAFRGLDISLDSAKIANRHANINNAITQIHTVTNISNKSDNTRL